MVLESIVTSLLNQYLGTFVEGLDASQLKLNVWSGKVNLQHLSIKPSAVEALHLPVTIIHGHIDALVLEANWRSLTSQPVAVKIHGVNLLLATRQEYSIDTQQELTRIITQKLTSLNTIQEFRLQAESEAAKQSSSTTKYISRITETIIDNIQLSIKDVHVRIQFPHDEGATHQQITVGMGVEDLSAYTTDAEGKRAFLQGQAIGYRQVHLANFFIYLNEQNESKEQQRISDDDAEDEVHRNALSVLEDDNTQYILSPVSGDLHMIMNKDETFSPHISLSATFPLISLQLAQSHYHHLLHLLSSLSSSHSHLQELLASTITKDAQTEPTKAQRQTYINLYKRTLNALWLPELKPTEQQELDSLERDLSYDSLSRLRTAALL